MLGRLKELSELSAVSGNEKAVRKYIKEFAKQYTDDIKTDSMGNLYVHKKGNGKKIMLVAHMDEVGMMICQIHDNGFLSFQATNLDPRVVVSKRVEIGEKKIPGIIGSKAIHLQSAAERKRTLAHDELYIDIGANDKKDAQKKVKLGDFVSFTTKFEPFGEGLFKGKALDDRIGCAIVMELMKNDYDCDLYCVFTVQEETGTRGSMVVTENVQPDLALIFEGTTANDMPGCEGHETVTTVGEGPAITFMDGATIVNRKLINALIESAEEANIPYQFRKGINGGTDAGPIHTSGYGCIAGGISVGCRYIHSPVSVGSEKDFENAFKLADYFMKTKKFEKVLEG